MGPEREGRRKAPALHAADPSSCLAPRTVLLGAASRGPLSDGQEHPKSQWVSTSYFIPAEPGGHPNLSFSGPDSATGKGGHTGGWGLRLTPDPSFFCWSREFCDHGCRMGQGLVSCDLFATCMTCTQCGLFRTARQPRKDSEFKSQWSLAVAKICVKQKRAGAEGRN